MLNRFKGISPIGILALIALVVGGFLFAKGFSKSFVWMFSPWSNIIREFMAVFRGWNGWTLHIGFVLLVAGIIILYKNREVITSKKAIVNVIVLIITLSNAWTISLDLLFDINHRFDISMTFLTMKVVGEFGWGYHLAFLLFIAGVIYLVLESTRDQRNESFGIQKEHIQAPQPQVSQSQQGFQQQMVQPAMETKQLSVLQWLGTLILVGIPVVNFILLLVWGFGEDNPRKNFSLGVLLYSLIVTVLSLLVIVLSVLTGI